MGYIRREVVVNEADWNNLFEAMRQRLRHHFDNLHLPNENDDEQRRIKWQREQAERSFLRMKGKLDGQWIGEL